MAARSHAKQSCAHMQFNLDFNSNNNTRFQQLLQRNLQRSLPSMFPNSFAFNGTGECPNFVTVDHLSRGSIIADLTIDLGFGKSSQDASNFEVGDCLPLCVPCSRISPWCCNVYKRTGKISAYFLLCSAPVTGDGGSSPLLFSSLSLPCAHLGYSLTFLKSEGSHCTDPVGSKGAVQ